MTGRLEDFLGFRTWVVYNSSPDPVVYATYDNQYTVDCPSERAVRIRTNPHARHWIVFVELMTENDAARHILYMEKVFAKTGVKSRRLRVV